jgi:hypothetical protein
MHCEYFLPECGSLFLQKQIFEKLEDKLMHIHQGPSLGVTKPIVNVFEKLLHSALQHKMPYYTKTESFQFIVLSLSRAVHTHWASGECHRTHGPTRDNIHTRSSTLWGGEERSIYIYIYVSSHI